jgi:peptide-methionine (R)-S-oxide reductase
MSDSDQKNDDHWRTALSPEEFHVCRQKGTERPFTGEYWDCKKPGTYVCRCCAEPLFHSSTKYDSGSGWPSFYSAVNPQAVSENRDISHGMIRTEILCQKCQAHLGHVFPDGPKPTGLRFCVNSASLRLLPDTAEG